MTILSSKLIHDGDDDVIGWKLLHLNRIKCRGNFYDTDVKM